jgi:hypothetical protein
MQVQLKLTLTQMSSLYNSMQVILADLDAYDRHLQPLIEHHLNRICNKLKERMSNARPGRKSSLNLRPVDASALMVSFKPIAFNKSADSAIVQTILMEVDRHF